MISLNLPAACEVGNCHSDFTEPQEGRTTGAEGHRAQKPHGVRKGDLTTSAPGGSRVPDTRCRGPPETCAPSREVQLPGPRALLFEAVSSLLQEISKLVSSDTNCSTHFSFVFFQEHLGPLFILPVLL